MDKRRFWSRVDRQDIDTCWNWLAGTDRDGYGQFRILGKQLVASRVAFQFAGKGSVPADLCVLHTCDNPKCCNPSHLYLGTHFDNAQDREERTKANGLSRSRVRLIRAMQLSGHYTQKEIAGIFNVTQVCISYIVRGLRR